MSKNNGKELRVFTPIFPAAAEEGNRSFGMDHALFLVGKSFGWEITNQAGVYSLMKSFNFPDLTRGLDFAVQVGNLAQRENNPPVLIIEWGRVTITWSTRGAKGFHNHDLICAGKTDEIYRGSHS